MRTYFRVSLDREVPILPLQHFTVDFSKACPDDFCSIMKPRFLTFAGILVFAAQPLLAQSQTSPEFLPLGIGNSWTYVEIIDAPFSEPDTVWFDPYVVSDTVSFEDTLYYVWNHPSPFVDTLRSDADGRIWARIDGSDELLFDFTLDSGGTYSVREYEVTVQHEDTVTVAAGRFLDAVTILFDRPDAVDDEHSFTFAEGVGIISAFGTGQVNELYSAQIGDEKLGATGIEDDRFSGRLRATAFPNPFTTRARIQLESRSRRPARAAVYNLVGRKVAELQPQECSTTSCVFVWDAPNLPNGVYFVAISQGRLNKSLPLVKMR